MPRRKKISEYPSALKGWQPIAAFLGQQVSVASTLGGLESLLASPLETWKSGAELPHGGHLSQKNFAC